MWFTNSSYEDLTGSYPGSIGRITTAGIITNYPLPTGVDADQITTGSDGALWFTNPDFEGFGGSIGRITTSGVITNYSESSILEPEGIAAGPDGALWFTNHVGNSHRGSIGRITTSGVITNYTYPTINGPEGITAGPNGAMWFTNNRKAAVIPESIGRIITSVDNLALSITSSTSDAFTQSVADSFTVTTTGLPALTETGSLPSGVSFTDNGNGTASLSGAASSSGIFPITITASNGVLPDATQSFTLTVNPPVTNWTQLSPNASPGALGASSMAYDPATSQLLLFGGIPSANHFVNGTWTWNGTTWNELSPTTSPSPRGNASMAYDAATGQLLLFGGYGPGPTYLNDTWSWNGSTWTQLSPATSPPVRYNASMAYDPAAAELLLFGGLGNSTSTGGDTWSWNGSTWTQLSPLSSPSARSRAMLAYDPATSQLILFGGYSTNSSTPLADTWSWDGTTWDELSPAVSPAPRGYGAFAFDPTTQQLVLFGGVAGSSYFGDTWDWNGTTGWIQLFPESSPSNRYRSAAAYDATTSQLLLFGGGTVSVSQGDTWPYAPQAPTVPTAPTIGTATTMATAGNAQATVTFNPPSSNGGAAVSSYTVTATDLTTPANGGQTASGSESPITVAGLTNGDSYTFTVTATNSVGTGASSSASNAVTAPDSPPGSPVIGTATGGNASATVAFNPSESDGGESISSYTVTAFDATTVANGGQTASGSESPITVAGLTNGDSYTLTVTATNSVGTGPESDPSNVVTPSTLPGPPTLVVATAGDAGASVSFSPPASNGGAAVISYTVTATDLTTPTNGGETASGAASPITVTGLTNGDSYTFTVTATNSAGTGPASDPSNTVVPVSPIGIASVSPSYLVQGAKGVDIVIDGNGFVSPLTVAISGGGVTPSLVSVSPTSVTIKVNVSAVAIPGVRNVTVADTNGSATCMGCLTIVAKPTVASISPASLGQGAAKVPVTITGTGFASGATLAAGQHVTFYSVVVVNSTSITAQESVGAAAATGARNLTLNQGALGSATCTDCLTVLTGPQLASISPSSAARGTTTAVNLAGTGFATGATLTGPKGVTFTKVVVTSSTTITATMKVSATAPTGSNLSVTVTNDAAAGYGKVTGNILTISA